MNKEVSYKLAMLLKEKGYDLKVNSHYGIEFDWDKGKLVGDPELKIKEFDNWNSDRFIYGCSFSAPTISDVVMWIYEKYGIWIYTKPDCYGEEWCSKLSVASEEVWEDIDKRHNVVSAFRKFDNTHTSPIEAYEAGITYFLNNLIK